MELTENLDHTQIGIQWMPGHLDDKTKAEKRENILVLQSIKKHSKVYL